MNHLSPERLAQIRDGADPADPEAEHLLDCASCRDDLDADPTLDQAMALLRATPPLSPEAQRRIEPRLVASLRWQRSRPALYALAAFAAAALLLIGWRLGAPRSHAAVATADGGQVQQLERGDDEVLSLEGEATFRVRHLAPGHRFRVRAGTDEIEVKGTTFRLRTGSGGLAQVLVYEGLVEVRTTCCGTRLVAGGQQWDRPQPSASASSSPDPTPGPSPDPSSTALAPTAQAPSDPPSDTSPDSPRPPPSATGPRPAESSIELWRQANAAYDSGQYAQAAALYDRAVGSEPQASWARDARTLAGVSRVLASPADSIPSLGVGADIFDRAAQKALSTGDPRRAAAARLGAARRLQGDGRRQRFCALKADASLPPSLRSEAERECAMWTRD